MVYSVPPVASKMTCRCEPHCLVGGSHTSSSSVPPVATSMLDDAAAEPHVSAT
jgi:hypothetical protein